MGWPRTTTVFPEPTWWNGGPDDDRYEDYETCPTCGGEGAWEKPQPQPDDPHFCIVVECETCNGSGLAIR